MLTRRSLLLRSTLLGSTMAVAAVPALAQPRHPPPHRQAAGKGQPKDALPQSTDGPAQTPIGPVDTTAHWAYIEDFTTGAVLLDKRSSEQMPPSSMTKLMTLYIVLDRLRQGRMKLDDQLAGVGGGVADGRLQDVRAHRHHGLDRGPAPRHHRRFR